MQHVHEKAGVWIVVLLSGVEFDSHLAYRVGNLEMQPLQAASS